MADETTGMFISKVIGIGTIIVGSIISWISGRKNAEKTATETLGLALESLSEQNEKQELRIANLEHTVDDLRSKLADVQDSLYRERREHNDALHAEQMLLNKALELIKALIAQVNGYAVRVGEQAPYNEAEVLSIFARKPKT